MIYLLNNYASSPATTRGANTEEIRWSEPNINLIDLHIVSLATGIIGVGTRPNRSSDRANGRPGPKAADLDLVH